MTRIVPMTLESGEEIYLEATGSADYRPAGIRGGAVEAVAESFEQALDKVKPAARAVVEAFRELNEPDEIGIEFGIQFSSELKAFVLTGEANASFKLSLKWKCDPKRSGS